MFQKIFRVPLGVKARATAQQTPSSRVARKADPLLVLVEVLRGECWVFAGV